MDTIIHSRIKKMSPQVEETRKILESIRQTNPVLYGPFIVSRKK